MLDSYFEMLKGYFSIKGKVDRHKYWSGLLITLVILSILLWFGEKLPTLNFLPAGFAILMAIPTITATVRRLHDVSRSGWWVLLFLLPVIGWICIFIFLVQQTQDENLAKKKLQKKDNSPRLYNGYGR